MDRKRRQLLTMLAAAPLAVRAGWLVPEHPLQRRPAPGTLDIFLHGFFFTEILGSKLVIASPEYNDHVFAYWDHTDNTLHAPPPASSPFTWVSALDPSGSANSFPSDLLHFSRQSVGSGDEPFIVPPDLKHRYAWYLELPLPSKIVGVRDGGNISEFVIPMGNHVGESVKKHCGPTGNLKLITCLHYNTIRSVNVSRVNFYAEHCNKPKVVDLNDLFAQTSKELPKFDFVFADIKEGQSLPCAKTDDEKLLCELGTVSPNPCSPCSCPPPKEMIRTANCPQFGIVQT
jgi:hypothetical protein